jgi:large subunit ribosomal protein L4
MAEKKETKKNTEVKLNPKVWEVPFNEDLVTQVLYVYSSNERKGTSNVKGKGEVRGGGKKPWKQKGTGRARAGSIRSPLWVGGGVTFGPNERNWKRSINKKMVTKATCIMLSQRLRENTIDFMNMGENTEKKEIRDNISANKALIVTDNKDIDLALRNVKTVKVIKPMKLNAKHVVSTKKLIIDKESVKILEDRLTNGK